MKATSANLITNQLYAVSVAKNLAILLGIAEIKNVATTAEKHILKVLTVHKNPACANCNIKGHSSTSKDCPVYIKLKAQLQHEVRSTKYCLF